MTTVTSGHPAWKAFRAWHLAAYHVEPNLAIKEHQKVWQDFLSGWESAEKRNDGKDMGLVVNPEGK